MAVNSYLIQKWYKMIIGRSGLHVNQGIGKIYSKDKIKGYYNDLTEKVSKFGLPEATVPKSKVGRGEEIYFSIAIFQYGLAAYDLFLMSEKQDKSMLAKVLACADWAIENQQEDGAWVTFEFENAEYPYSAMAQGEAISLLLRAYIETENDVYVSAVKKARDFLVLPFEKGGPAEYVGSNLYLYECPKDPLILNGWIFSIWGLMDYCKSFEDEKSQELLNRTLLTLEKSLPLFDLPYWSMYEDGKRICSPFYHKLHVAQLKVMYDLTGKEIYKYYAERWASFENKFFFRIYAFVKKALQKILE